MKVRARDLRDPTPGVTKKMLAAARALGKACRDSADAIVAKKMKESVATKCAPGQAEAPIHATATRTAPREGADTPANGRVVLPHEAACACPRCRDARAQRALVLDPHPSTAPVPDPVCVKTCGACWACRRKAGGVFFWLEPNDPLVDAAIEILERPPRRGARP